MADMTQNELRRASGPIGPLLAPMDALFVDFTDGMLRGAAKIVSDPFAWLLRVQARSRQRRRLMEMDDRLLRDIGLDRAQVKAEAGKPFWKR
jgi:uncharacterized protein YjiS (DUF1127 family)